jgi:hypothetical protein
MENPVYEQLQAGKVKVTLRMMQHAQRGWKRPPDLSVLSVITLAGPHRRAGLKAKA